MNRLISSKQSGSILQKTENGKTQHYFYAGGKALAEQAKRLESEKANRAFADDFARRKQATDFWLKPASGQGGGGINVAGIGFIPSGEEAPEPISTQRTVTVRTGDTLTRLARTSDPDTLDRIAQYNGLSSRHEIRAGAQLVIPDADTLAGVDVAGAVRDRGAAGAKYYAERQAEVAQEANEPVWSFREASAQRKIDDALAARAEMLNNVSGSISAAPPRGMLDDLSAAVDGYGTPLSKGHKILTRILNQSQYEYEYAGGSRREDSWKLRLGAGLEFAGWVVAPTVALTRGSVTVGAIEFFNLKSTDAVVGGAAGGFFDATDQAYQMYRDPDKRYNPLQTTSAIITGGAAGYLGSGKAFGQRWVIQRQGIWRTRPSPIG